VTVVDHKDRFLARGYWNIKSQIQVRILTWQDEVIDKAWWKHQFIRAIRSRRSLNENFRPYQTRSLNENFRPYQTSNNAFRLVNAENDFLPGLVVDYYDGWMVMQALTLGIDSRKIDLAHWLIEAWMESPDTGDRDKSAIKGIYERSDVEVRGKEGLRPSLGLQGLRPSLGLLWGEEPPPLIRVRENLTLYDIDVRQGHKTGFYLDQRNNRERLVTLNEDYLPINSGDGMSSSTPLRILNLFSYTGGFGIAAFSTRWAHSQIINIDASREALELAEKNWQINNDLYAKAGDPPQEMEFIQADVFDYLHDQVAEGAQYDVIICDPPKFALCDPPKFAHNAGQVERAARGYKDLNLNCFKLMKPGGYLMTFSCSGAITQDLFQKIVFGALEDSGRQAQIIQHLGPGADHPVALTFPEGAYLKGLLLRVY